MYEIIINTLNVMDAVSTYILLQNPLKYELNPILAHIINMSGLFMFAILKIFIIFVAVRWFTKKFKVKHPTHYKIGIGICIFYYLFVVMLNVSQVGGFL